MRVYDKNDVDVTFSNWFMDLEQLTSFDAIPIPEGATNGDIMKLVFPELEFKQGEDGISTMFMKMNNSAGIASLYVDWWNAPYKGVEE